MQYSQLFTLFGLFDQVYFVSQETTFPFAEYRLVLCEPTPESARNTVKD